MKKLLIFIGLTLLSSTLVYTQDLDSVVDVPFEELFKMEIITADRTSQKINEVPASVVVVTREDIEKYGYRTIAELFENVPGLYKINDYGWHGSVFGVRGFNTGRSKNFSVMINGIDQLFEADKSISIEALGVPINSIERIEIIRGPMSVIYGSGAFLGAINIITNNFNEKEGVRINHASFAYGTNNRFSGSGSVEQHTNDLKLRVNLGLEVTEGPDFKYTEMTNTPAILASYGLPIDKSVKGDLEQETKFFELNAKLKHFYFNTMFTETERGAFLLFPSPNQNQYVKSPNLSIIAGYKNSFSEKFTLDLKHTHIIKSWNPNYDWFWQNFNGWFNRKEIVNKSEINISFKPVEKWHLVGGLIFKHYKIDGKLHMEGLQRDLWDGYWLSPFGAPNLATYLQIEYNINNKLKIVAGGRLDYMFEYEINKLYDFTFSPVTFSSSPTRLVHMVSSDMSIIPRFAAVYSPTKNHIVKLLYGEAVNQPSFIDYIENLLEGITPQKLNPERIRTLELNYMAKIVPSKLMVNFSLYRNTMDDLVMSAASWNEQGNWFPYNHNLGKMFTTGLELTTRYVPFRNFELNLSWTHQRTKNMFDEMKDQKVILSPENLGYLKMSYSSPFNFVFSLTATYIDKMKPFYDIRPIDNTDINSGAVGSVGDDIDAYYLLGVNIRANWLFNTGLFMNFKVSNIFDHEIRYPAMAVNPTWTDKGTIGYGRQFNVTIGYYF